MSSEDADFLNYLCDTNSQSVIDWSQTNGGERSFVFEERLSRANVLVDGGNGLFKAGNHSEAQKHYLAAAYQVDFDFGQQFEMTDEHRKQIRSIKVRILLNICNNLLKLKDYKGVRRAATLGLKLNGTEKVDNVAKFLYRRGRANLEENNPTDAVEDLREAVKLVPSDATVRELFSIASAASKKQKSDADNVWKGKIAAQSDPLAEVLGPIEHFPKVDLIITDNDGNPIYKSSDAVTPSLKNLTATTHEKPVSFWDIICCKRKRQQQHQKLN
jgi:tetratricopeptide (TPR) repeat protein